MRCWRRIGTRFLSAVVALGMCMGDGPRAVAETGVAGPPTSLAGELQSLATGAGVIFCGQVVSIQRRGGVVEVTFNVEQAVAGDVGATYVLREWAGLWPQGQFRYTVGQRALIFLRTASAAGLASPVDSAEGVVPVVVQGADAPALLDVRRLASAVLRPVGSPLPTEADGAIQLSDAIAVVSAAREHRLRPVTEPLRVMLPSRGLPPRGGAGADEGAGELLPTTGGSLQGGRIGGVVEVRDGSR